MHVLTTLFVCRLKTLSWCLELNKICYVYVMLCYMQDQWKSEQVLDKTALPVFFFFFFVFFFFFFFFVFCKDPAKNVRIPKHMLIWNFVGHMFSWSTSNISCKSFSTVKSQRPWSDCTDVHECICWSRTLLVRCFLGITLYFILFIFSLTRPYFTDVYLLQTPRSNCMAAHYTKLSTIFDTPFHLS